MMILVDKSIFCDHKGHKKAESFPPAWIERYDHFCRVCGQEWAWCNHDDLKPTHWNQNKPEVEGFKIQDTCPVCSKKEFESSTTNLPFYFHPISSSSWDKCPCCMNTSDFWGKCSCNTTTTNSYSS